MNSCPGCGALLPELVCCYDCWDRLPDTLPNYPTPWRAALDECKVHAKAGNLAARAECLKISDAIVMWLGTHKV